MSRRKDEALSKLGDEDLLKLAKSVSDMPINSRASRNALAKIVRESLSIEEIEKRTKGIGQPRTEGVLRSSHLLIASIILIFVGFTLRFIVTVRFYDQYFYTQTVAYGGERRAFVALFQLYYNLTIIGELIGTVGLALLTCWLFLSAIRASAASNAMAALLVSGGIFVLLLSALLLTSMSGVISPSPYYYYYS